MFNTAEVQTDTHNAQSHCIHFYLPCGKGRTIVGFKVTNFLAHLTFICILRELEATQTMCCGCCF